jgi:hypothetical protein
MSSSTSSSLQTIYQEVELFAQSISILDTSLSKSDPETESKRKQAITRLKSKVSLEDAKRALEQAIKSGDEDGRIHAEKALAALMDSIPKDAAYELLKQGLKHPVPSTRISSINKIAQSSEITPEMKILIVQRIADSDTQVAKIAIDFLKKQLNSSNENDASRGVLLETLKNIACSKPEAVDGNSADAATSQLRAWEVAADLVKSNSTEVIQSQAVEILNTMFASLEQWNDDVLVVLNQLEIAASLPRTFFANRGDKLVPILLRYATEQDMVADDALRVLAALHFESLTPSSTIDAFFTALDRKLTRENFSLASLEVLGMFLGANSECFKFALDKKGQTVQQWMSLVCKYAHDGNDVPRTVALDAVSRAVRGGSLLKEPFSSTANMFKQENSPEYVDSQTSSIYGWRLLKDSIETIMRSVNAAIRSLHPQVQIAGYQLIRLLVSQNAKWGILKAFEYIPRDLLLNIDNMPSPNSNAQVSEARLAAMSASALKFLTEEEEISLSNAIKQFVKNSLDPHRSRITKATVDVATMRA